MDTKHGSQFSRPVACAQLARGQTLIINPSAYFNLYRQTHSGFKFKLILDIKYIAKFKIKKLTYFAKSSSKEICKQK